MDALRRDEVHHFLYVVRSRHSSAQASSSAGKLALRLLPLLVGSHPHCNDLVPLFRLQNGRSMGLA